MERFTDKVVLITGGNSGIGRAVAHRIAEEGGTVVLGARRVDEGEEVAAEIRATGGRAVFQRCDVTVEAEVAALVRAAVDSFGRLDAAFNNAGVVSTVGMLQDVDREDWDRDIAVNLTGTFHCLKHEIPAMLASGGGSILNTSSTLGVRAIPSTSPYIAAKHGIIGLTRAAAVELAQSGIRVNALVTGAVDTPMLEGNIGSEADRGAVIASFHAMNRVGAPGEIAAFAAFLLSSESSFTTGAALAIDGGWTAR